MCILFHVKQFVRSAKPPSSLTRSSRMRTSTATCVTIFTISCFSYPMTVSRFIPSASSAPFLCALPSVDSFHSTLICRCHCVLCSSLQTEDAMLGRCDGCPSVLRNSSTCRGSLHALRVSLVLAGRFRVLPALPQPFLLLHSSLPLSFSETRSSDQPAAINLLLVRDMRNLPLAGVLFPSFFHFDPFALHTADHFFRDVISSNRNKQAFSSCPFHPFRPTKRPFCDSWPIGLFCPTWTSHSTFFEKSAGISGILSADAASSV